MVARKFTKNFVNIELEQNSILAVQRRRKDYPKQHKFGWLVTKIRAIDQTLIKIIGTKIQAIDQTNKKYWHKMGSANGCNKVKF